MPFARTALRALEQRDICAGRRIRCEDGSTRQRRAGRRRQDQHAGRAAGIDEAGGRELRALGRVFVEDGIGVVDVDQNFALGSEGLEHLHHAARTRLRKTYAVV